MFLKIFCIILFAILIFMVGHTKKIEKKLEEKKDKISSLKKDLRDAQRMENNVEIVRFADGKHYAIVNIHNAIKSPLFKDIRERSEGDIFVLEYRANENLPSIRIEGVACGVRMLVFPIPDERKDDISFEVKKIYTVNHEGEMKDFISGDIFYNSKINEYVIHVDAEDKKVYIGKKMAEKLGYVDDGKGGLIKKEQTKKSD